MAQAAGGDQAAAPARVLVVEDEPAIRDAVAYSLRTHGFEVGEEATATDSLATALAGRWDLVVLDVMLPDLSGFEVCRRLRAQSDVPIVLLTARDAEVDRVLGLETGADDYLTKPFSMPELISRVRALLRRRQLDRHARVLQAGSLSLDLVRQEVRVTGQPVTMTGTEFRLLALLASEQRPFSRDEIMRHLWSSSWAGGGRTVDAHVKNVRRKIVSAGGTPQSVQTVRGVGYALAR